MPLLALGFAGDLDLSSAPGILRSLRSPNGRWPTTLPLNYDDSGSPIFHEDGAVVAVAVGGRDDMQSITFVIPIAFARPLLEMAGVRTAFSAPAPVTAALEAEALSKTFKFYKTSESPLDMNFSQNYCLPDGYRIDRAEIRETTKNGPSQAILRRLDESPNCVRLDAQFRPVQRDVFGDLGRGRSWIGADVLLTGSRAKALPPPRVNVP